MTRSTPSRVELFIFDLDDTLFPEIAFVRSGFQAVAAYLARDSAERERLVQRLWELFAESRTGVLDRLVREMADIGAGNEIELGKLVRELIRVYRQHDPEIAPYPDVVPTLSLLRSAGFRTALLTDGIAAVQKRKVAALGLASWFDLMVYTDDLGPDRVFWKPNPRGFEVILQELGIRPSAACYVGDNPSKDFQGPQGLGLRTAWVRRSGALYAQGRQPAVDAAPVDVIGEDLGCLAPLWRGDGVW